MNKTDLTESLGSRAGISKAEARRCIDALFDAPGGIIARALSRNEKVRITGFGIFETRTRKARSGRNPRTGEKIRIAASRTAIFRAPSRPGARARRPRHDRDARTPLGP